MKTHINIPLQKREASIAVEQNAEDTTFRVIWTTGARVRRYDYESGTYYDEELVVTQESVRLDRINSGAAPVLNAHSSYSLDDVIGVVLPNSVTFEKGNQSSLSLKLDDGTETEPILRKIKNGTIRNVSAGYRVHKYEIIQQENTVPLYRAVDWEPYEISFVPIGADSGAGIRSAGVHYPCVLTRNLPVTEPHMKQTTTEPDNTPPAINPDTIRQEAVTAERKRVSEINHIVRAAKLPESFAATLIEHGTGIDNARKAVLDELARKSDEPGEINSHVQVTRDELDSCRNSIENALLHRFKPDVFKLDSGSREYRGMTLIEMGRDLLERRNIRTRGMSRAQLAGEMLGLPTMQSRDVSVDMETRGGFHGSSDFPYILANIANKTLRAAYEAAPQTFKPFCRQSTSPDFKNVARTQLGDAPSLEKVNENGEFKRGSVSDAREQYALATYGKVVAINRQAIINDDLDAFTRLPEMFGRAAADLESDTVWGIITGNPAMGDTVALFHANHGNLAGSGTAITVSALGGGRAALRQQKGLNGRFINIMAKYLLVPSAIETTADQYVTQTNIIYTKNSDYNPFANKLQVIAEPRLDANSATAWYLAGDPGQIDTIEYAYLEGQEGVYLENRIGFDVDGIELKARLDFAAKAIDWRGFYKNPGA